MSRMTRRRSALRGTQRLWLVATAVVLFVFAALEWLPSGVLGVSAEINDLADGRTGRISFRSYTPTPSDVETGTFKYGAVTVTGELTLPSGLDGRVPAAVLLHGSNGVSDLQHRYAKILADWGIASLVIDSFGPRGVRSTVGNQGAVSPHAMVIDAYAVLDLLATHPRIDADRVVLIGWSKGGIATELATRRRYRDLMARGGHGFAGHAAFYSWCGEQESEIDLTGAPLLFLLGADDDWTGAQACSDYAERLRGLGYPARAIVYPDAGHGFDYEGRARIYLAKAQSWAECRYIARADGFVVAQDGRFEPWSRLPDYFAACSRPGAHVVPNPKVRARAREDLKAFLTSVFDLR